VLVDEGPARIADLARIGVEFDRDAGGEYSLGREGGHGRRRILHAGGSATGAAIAEVLIDLVEAHPRITVLEHTALIGLIADGAACDGGWLLGHDELRAVPARMTLIATGGSGGLFERTTNPPGALGDGIALAHRVGASIRDMEFVQFHPTALAVGERAFLISEAVRGEGAHLLTAAGERFMPAEHPDAELAPRDVVARVIQDRLAAGERSYLSLAHLDAEEVRRRFPNLVAGVAAAGLDLLRDPIPVAPAAHYLMGGIETGTDGRSTLDGLYAAGECASSGSHGANRLASNSLLECFVFAHRAVDHGLSGPTRRGVDCAPPERPLARAPLPDIRRRMWRDAGPIRDGERLAALCSWLEEQPPSNPVLIARLIATSALRRTESRGAHIRRDHPEEDPRLARSLRSPSLTSMV